MTVTNIIGLVAKTVGKTSAQTLEDPHLYKLVKTLVIYDGLPRADQLTFIAFLNTLKAGKNK